MSLRPVVCLLACAVAAGAEPPLASIVGKVERRTATRLLSLAKSAELADLHRTARRLRERVLVLEPDRAAARRRLGYTRVKGGWKPDPEARKELLALQDADPELAKRFARDLALLERERLDEIVRVCTQYGTPAEKEAVLTPFVERMPQRADLRRALGHVQVAGRWVRPALAGLVRRMQWDVPAWRRHAEEAVAPAPVAAPLVLPGLDPQPAFHEAEGRRVASTLPPAQALRAARDVARTQRLVRWMLGKEAAVWDPSPVLLLQPKPYAAFVRALHPDEAEFKLYSRFANYEHGDFYAIRVWSAEDAGERYAHAAGYMTMYELAAPAARAGKGARDTRAYAWLLEGFGYLLGFELFDRGNVSYVSILETARKRTFTRPPPARKTRADCLRWLREQLLAGRGHPLRAVCAKSLNNLDFCASMQAWTFVRFLLLEDRDAFRRLAPALRARATGPQAERTDAALRAVFGRGLDELAAPWRAFVLEIGHD